jgi:hypothetical protein
LHNDWQFLGKGFADAARTRLADEKVRKLHVQRNIPGKAAHQHRDSLPHGSEVGDGRFAFFASEDQLPPGVFPV